MTSLIDETQPMLVVKRRSRSGKEQKSKRMNKRPQYMHKFFHNILLILFIHYERSGVWIFQQIPSNQRSASTAAFKNSRIPANLEQTVFSNSTLLVVKKNYVPVTPYQITCRILYQWSWIDRQLIHEPSRIKIGIK